MEIEPKMIIDANPQVIGKKLELFKHYHLEVLLIIFALAIVYLFKGQADLQNDMKKYLNEDRRDLIEKVVLNTGVVSESNKILNEVKAVLNENQEILKDIKSK